MVVRVGSRLKWMGLLTTKGCKISMLRCEKGLDNSFQFKKRIQLQYAIGHVGESIEYYQSLLLITCLTLELWTSAKLMAELLELRQADYSVFTNVATTTLAACRIRSREKRSPFLQLQLRLRPGKDRGRKKYKIATSLESIIGTTTLICLFSNSR